MNFSTTVALLVILPHHLFSALTPLSIYTEENTHIYCAEKILFCTRLLILRVRFMAYGMLNI